MAERSAIVQDLAWRSFGTSKKNAEKTIGAVSDLFCEYVPGGLGIEESKGHRKVDGRSERRLYSLFPRAYMHPRTRSFHPYFRGRVMWNMPRKWKSSSDSCYRCRTNQWCEIAESVLQSKKADLVTMARASGGSGTAKQGSERTGRYDPLYQLSAGLYRRERKRNGIRCLVNPVYRNGRWIMIWLYRKGKTGPRYRWWYCRMWGCDLGSVKGS